jgi:hypothetical protein
LLGSHLASLELAVRWTQRLHSIFVLFRCQVRLCACPQPRLDWDASSILSRHRAVSITSMSTDIDRSSADSKLAKQRLKTVHLYIPGISRCRDLDNTFFGLLIFLRPLTFLSPFRFFFVIGATRRQLYRVPDSHLPLFGLASVIARGPSPSRALSNAASLRPKPYMPSLLYHFLPLLYTLAFHPCLLK